MVWTLSAGFRCCYCYHMNEARKQRPRAPSLDEREASLTHPASQQGNTSFHWISMTHTKPMTKLKKQ